jgi:hypothetical protein
MDTYKKKAVFERLKGFCTFAKENDYIEITQWYNGEGFDVDICGTKSERFQLTYGEYELLKKLVKNLNK